VKHADVPQDDARTLAGVRKAVYALDEAGRYTTVATSGWTVEEAVTGAAVDEYRRLAREAWDTARRGAASPLLFHMYDRRMDEPMLAQTLGVWRWRLRRHFKPAVFGALSAAWLARYADALGLPVDTLRRLPDAPPEAGA
jgi:hypothetical protein